MTSPVDTTAALEAIVGRTPPAIHLKVIDHLDESALRWLSASPFAFISMGDGRGARVTMAGGGPGFAGGDRAMLHIPLIAMDDAEGLKPGRGFGSLFLAPGIGETLRVNGRVAHVDADQVHVAVEECYVHCAKALIRSAFWEAEPIAGPPEDAATFVAASRFMALATVDKQGRADLSPKGDPAGLMARVEEGTLWFADRPGNRRVDSFRNILSQPRIAMTLLLPGSTRVATLSGTASLTADAETRARFAVQGKTPLLAVRVDGAALDLRESGALARARLWPMGQKAERIDPAAMFVAHVKLNRDKGLGARLAGAVMSVPGLMRKGLEKDYKSNLY
ncbi:pyridoxamine 5'-phosphate oxidase family protein [Sphingobium cloacae]|nr:pyridoxamine 5'-phosphate oxidase family protein [Sphingobium cloacae]